MFDKGAAMSAYTGFVASHAIPLWAMVSGVLAAPVAAQGAAGHFYQVNYYQVRSGQEKAYDSALTHVVAPVLTELVKRKGAVSYLLLTKVAGSGDYTNLVIVEVANNTPATGEFQRDWDAASQAALHRSWEEATAGFPALRRFVHAELYTTTGQLREP
jgi:hypothetical protein